MPGPIHSNLDPLTLRTDLDAVLASKGLEFTPNLDESFRDDLRTSWRQLARARGGILTSADMGDTLRSYLRIGLVRKPPAPDREGRGAPHPTLPEETLGYLATKAPKRPTGPNGPLPTIVRLTSAKGPDGHARPIPSVVYGSFSSEFGTHAFEGQDASGSVRIFPVTHVDPRFQKLVGMLTEEHIAVVLVGEEDADDLAVWDLQAVTELPEGDTQTLVPPDMLEEMLENLRALPEPEAAPRIKATPAANTRSRAWLTNVDDVSRYLACMEDTLPANIRTWAYRNLGVVNNDKASKEERRHATRALSLLLSVRWGKASFRRVDPTHARAILDQQLFGLDPVKQRVIETIVQINRTHTLPLYGLLLAGPAGVGKSQIAYATARILDLPWASLDMSAIRDLPALIGSDRVYANAKPGRVMEALAQAGSANMVLVINELDKADEGGQNGNSADALLTLFDNLGFTDNYIECSIPTDGIYPIATANDLSRIDAPLLSRFEVIELPDYTPDEKLVILRDFSLPKILSHMGLGGEEFSLTDAALQSVIERYLDESGCRSLEKAAEHLAAHALFLLESDPSLDHVTFDAEDVRTVLDS